MKLKYLLFLALLCLKEGIALKKDLAYCKSKFSLIPSKIVGIQVLIRHGARNIVKTFEKDIYKKENFTGELGDLTAEGKVQEYNLGVWLRKRYSSLFKGPNPEKMVYAESSHSDRVFMSAKYCLAGLIPKTKNQTYYENIINEWEPVQVNKVAKENDFTLATSASCPEHKRLRDLYKQSPEYLQKLKDHKSVMEEVAKLSGQNVTNFSEATYIYDTLKTELHQGKKIVDWGENQRIYKALEYMNLQEFKSHTATQQLAYLRGFLLKQFLNNFSNKRQSNDNSPNFRLSAGHDYTIAALLDIMGLFNNVLPSFGACVMFELHELQGKYYVKIFYREDDTKKRYTIAKLTTATLLCECLLDDMIKHNEDVLPVNDAHKECIKK